MNIRSTVTKVILVGILSLGAGKAMSQQGVTAPVVASVQSFVDNPNTLLSTYPTGEGLQAAAQALVMNSVAGGQLDAAIAALKAEIIRPGANPTVIMALFDASNGAAAALVESNQEAAAAIRQVLADRAVVAATEFARTRLASNGRPDENGTPSEIATSAISPSPAANTAIGGAGSTPGTGAGGTGTGASGGTASFTNNGTFAGAQSGGSTSITRTTSTCINNVSTDARCTN